VDIFFLHSRVLPEYSKSKGTKLSNPKDIFHIPFAQEFTPPPVEKQVSLPKNPLRPLPDNLKESYKALRSLPTELGECEHEYNTKKQELTRQRNQVHQLQSLKNMYLPHLKYIFLFMRSEK